MIKTNQLKKDPLDSQSCAVRRSYSVNGAPEKSPILSDSVQSSLIQFKVVKMFLSLFFSRTDKEVQNRLFF